MLIIRGSPALSSFRLQKLAQDLTASGVPVRALSAEFVHVAKLTGELTAALRDVLEKLLTYGPTRPPEKISGLLQVVAPRPGTISPWSSKATDIAHICGLTAIKRIERVIAYTVAFDSGYSPPATHCSLLSSKLHDRMTQVVFGEVAACDALFRHESPRAMASVPVLAQGRAADRKSTRLNSSHLRLSRMPSSA